MKNKSLILFVAIFALLLSACSKPGSPEASPSAKSAGESTTQPAQDSPAATTAAPKTLTIGIVNAPVTLNQINTQGSSASLAPINLLNEALLDVTDEAEFLPKLAESIETADKQTYRIKLKASAK